MAETREPLPVNLICGVLGGRTEWLDAARERLQVTFGPVDADSDLWPFDYTDYYEEEMGGGLLRRFHSFERLIDPGELPAAKVATNAMEAGLALSLGGSPARPVNLDPGYVSKAKLVLATTKDYAHRLYLGHGIYGEVTLQWQGGGFEPLQWTYPDYRSSHYIGFFARVRLAYTRKLAAMDD
jgi:hypothetical protein